MERRLIHRGRRFDLVEETIPLPDGSSVQKEIIVHPGAAVVVPILEDGRVCLVRNYRYSIAQTLLELPAGTLNPGESPEETARRELEEETGHRTATLTRLAVIYPSPGILDERMHLFIAKGLSPGKKQLDPGERVEPVLMDPALALAACKDGGIQDAKTIVGLFLVFGSRS